MGTAIILPTLTKIGRTDIAYKLLLQHDNPSWLYSVDQGATTIWERWNSYTLAEGFGDARMNSFNQYSYVAVLGWMYTDMAGIDYDTSNAGFKHFSLTPAPNQLIQSVKASFDSPYGTIISDMEYSSDGTSWTYKATVPANTTATINIPVSDKNNISINGKTINNVSISADGIELVTFENGVAIFNAVAGSFTFVDDFGIETNVSDTEITTDEISQNTTSNSFDTSEDQGAKDENVKKINKLPVIIGSVAAITACIIGLIVVLRKSRKRTQERI